MRVRFGSFVIDSGTRELLREDSSVHLSPKAFDLLAILVAHRPKALAKSDLLDRLWPNTFVVEKNLANLVSEIREAMGDDPSHPQFIRTVHRFGYAFREASSGTETDHRSSLSAGSFCFQWLGGRVALDEGEYVVGRDPDVDILLDSPGVSRRHAVIRIAARSATVEDLGSKNGTFIGERKIEGAVPLNHGDIIVVGSARLTVKVLHQTNTTETGQIEGPE